MPTTKNLLLYAIAIIVVAFIISRIPGYTVNILSHDHDSDEPIRMGTNVWPGYEPFYLARNTGILDDSVVNLLDFSSSTQVNRSLLNGTIDAAALTLEEVITLQASDVDVVVPMVIDFSFGGDAILARPGIDSMQALDGRVVAVPATSLGALMLARALELNDMPRDSVQVVYADLNEQEALYQTGSIDAVVTYSPVMDRLQALGMQPVFTSREIPGQIVDVLVVRSHIAEEHPEQLRALINGWFDALEYIEAEPMQAAALMEPRMQVPADVALKSLDNLQLVDLSTNLDYLSGETPQLNDSALSLQQIMIDGGFLEAPVDLMGLLYDGALLDVSRQRAGE